MEVIRDYWSVLGGLIAVVVWLVRLEGRVNTLDNNRSIDLQAAKEAREDTSSKLGKLEAQIGSRFDHVDQKIESAFTEVRTDIKTLIGQVAVGAVRVTRRRVSK
jgi:hypothetical protein